MVCNVGGVDKVLRIVESVGNPTPAHYEAARGLLARIPAPLHEATTTPEGARALLFALLLGEGDVRAAQLAAVTQVHGADIARLADGFVAPLRSLGPRARMPVMELIMPCLKELDADSRLAVLDSAQTLAEADRRMTLGEFVLLTLCRRHLSSPPKGGPPVKHKGFDTVTTEVVIVLSMIAHVAE